VKRGTKEAVTKCVVLEVLFPGLHIRLSHAGPYSCCDQHVPQGAGPYQFLGLLSKRTVEKGFTGLCNRVEEDDAGQEPPVPIV